MPLTDIHILDVQPGQAFHYAGRSYVLALDEEKAKHPASDVPGQVVAYHTPERGDRIPVSFSTRVRVFVEKKR